jgi:hypothetical protein
MVGSIKVGILIASDLLLSAAWQFEAAP